MVQLPFGAIPPLLVILILLGLLGATLFFLVRTRRALRTAEEGLVIQTALLDTLPIPVYMKDHERRFRGCNRAFTAFTGLSPEYIRGKRTEDHGDPALAEKYKRTDEELLRTGGSIRFTGTVMAADGSRKPVEFLKAVYTDAASGQAGIIGAFFDLSERVQSENEMRSMLTTRDKILAILSHDLLNPVWGMKKSLELESRPFSPESAELFAEEYSKSIGRIYNLLENLLGWARLQWRDLRVEPVEFDVMAMLREELGLESSARVNEHHRLKISGPPALMVCCDRNLLSILIRNLVTNALKYSPEDSLVDLVVQAGDRLQIYIIDRGPGIDMALSEALAKGDSILDSGSLRGHGFGLPLCRDVARLMSCDFKLENLPEGGTRAVLSIP
jgi:PAS domain S-box-containing protein